MHADMCVYVLVYTYVYIYIYTYIFWLYSIYRYRENEINITMIAATHHNPVCLAKDKESTTWPLNGC